MKNAIARYLNEDEYKKWDEFVESSLQGSIFHKSFWLNAVCESFKILVCEENNKIIGGIPLTPIYKKIYKNPKLTPKLGIVLQNSDSSIKYTTKLSKETEIIEFLISNLPDYNIFDYGFDYNFTNFMPFIWSEFNFKIGYTYVLEDLSDTNKILENMQYDVRYSINRAIKKGITVTSDYNIEDFYEVNKKTFSRQNIEIPYTFDYIKKIDTILNENNSRKILFAIDENKNIIAAVYLIYDKKCTYYLMGGADPKYRDTGAQTLLVWEGIKFAANVSGSFDFEGSIVKTIEKYFRGFGGKQKIIYNVCKYKPLYKIGYSFAAKNKNVIRKIIKK